MKSIKWIIALLLVAAGSGNVWADRGHWHGHGSAHFGVFVGPYWGAGYYGAPYYYPPYYPPYASPIVIERADPSVYIEQQAPLPAPAPAALTPGYWYYCQAALAYYPYVRECPAGWQRVAPQPAGQPRD